MSKPRVCSAAGCQGLTVQVCELCMRPVCREHQVVLAIFLLCWTCATAQVAQVEAIAQALAVKMSEVRHQKLFNAMLGWPRLERESKPGDRGSARHKKREKEAQ